MGNRARLQVNSVCRPIMGALVDGAALSAAPWPMPTKYNPWGLDDAWGVLRWPMARGGGGGAPCWGSEAFWDAHASGVGGGDDA